VAFGIFQLGFGQGGLGAGAPVDGLETPVDVALQVHLAEDADLGGFVLGLQGHVGGVPVAPDAIALEASPLAIDGFHRKGFGFFPQFDRGEVGAGLRIHGLEHLQLDGQAVAVPARDVAHFAPLEDLIFIDDVFEDFVEGVANVQVAVGVGGAVVQHKGLAGVLLG
jgi:hypothetical protein